MAVRAGRLSTAATVASATGTTSDSAQRRLVRWCRRASSCLRRRFTSRAYAPVVQVSHGAKPLQPEMDGSRREADGIGNQAFLPSGVPETAQCARSEKRMVMKEIVAWR
jgi:hypothetical protein